MSLNYNNTDFDIADEKHQKPQRGKSSGISGLYFKRLANSNYIKDAHTGTRPQAVFKIVSYAKGARVKNLISYLTRAKEEEKKQAAVETQDGVFYEAKTADEEIYKEWKKDFNRKKIKSKRNPRHAVHMIFSSAVKNTKKNTRKTLTAAKNTAAEVFGKKGYKYAVVLHEDTKHPHAHVIVNMKSSNPEQKKLKINKPELFGIRQRFTENLNKLDLYHSATLKQDRPGFVAKVSKDQAIVIENRNWFESKFKDFKKDAKIMRLGSTADFEKKINSKINLAEQDARRFLKYLKNFKTAKSPVAKKNSYAVLKKMRENIYKSIETAEDIIKDVPSFKEKNKALNSLELHKKLMQGKIKLKDVKTVQEDIKRSVTRFQRFHKEINEKLKQNISPSQKLLFKKELERRQNNHLQDIKNFKKEIIVSAAPKTDKMNALKYVASYQKVFDKKLGVGLGK
ncbi:MAG: relaxase/mobilization nuclease domain-containing protein [Deltaproteobacteria bacterium]|nr:relaxase/mobilization nuclease domain-containing protein [Deltaproteobacteria bacterium]